MKQHPFTPLRIILHIGGWFPLVQLIVDFATHHLTANPIQAMEQHTGLTALTFLVLAFACTPASSILDWKELLRRRRALGLYGFMYATLHVLIFFVIDYGLNFLAILRDVWNKWYILIGLTAFLLLLPMAITSFTYWMRRLGKNWKRLHRVIYVIVPLVAVHFLLSVKGDILRMQGNLAQPILYGALIAGLLMARIVPIRLRLIGARQRIEVWGRGVIGTLARVFTSQKR
jgi:sulfoxide reductase heme-binding subunit YedZ